MTVTKKFSLFLCALAIGLSLSTPAFVYAQEGENNPTDTSLAGSEGLVPCGSFSDNPCQLSDLFELVIIVTNFLIGMAGIVAVVAIVFGGYSLVTAAGNIEAVTGAKKLITNAFIGFFFVMAAFAVANFLIFGSRGIVRGEPTKDGKPAGIFICPIDYINPQEFDSLGNPICRGSKQGDERGDGGATDGSGEEDGGGSEGSGGGGTIDDGGTDGSGGGGTIDDGGTDGSGNGGGTIDGGGSEGSGGGTTKSCSDIFEREKRVIDATEQKCMDKARADSQIAACQAAAARSLRAAEQRRDECEARAE